MQQAHSLLHEGPSQGLLATALRQLLVGSASPAADVSCACWDLAAVISAPSLASAQRARLWAELQQWAHFSQQQNHLTVVPRERAGMNTTGQKEHLCQEPAAALAVAPAAAVAGHDEAATVAEQTMVGSFGDGGGEEGFGGGQSRRQGGCRSAAGPSSTACSPASQ